MTAAVVVVGGINQDVTVRVDARPAPGETVVGSGPVVSAGGKGANMAVATARAGATVAICGAVGDDAAGREQVDQLVAGGVAVDRVAVRTDVATGTALIVVTPDGENAIVVGAGANATLTDDEVAAACADAAVVLAQTEIGAAPVDAAARAVAATGGRLVLSPAPVVRLADETLALADPLVVNESEARDLLGGADASDLASAVRTRTGARSVVVTLGADGLRVADAAGGRHLPSPKVEVVDTTGAGDVLAGTLAAALAIGNALDDALASAIAAAAESVGYAGARAAQL
ncbi:MAG TPA: PfkB family carbohydrate kinase [Nocardioides sp.]|uniref:PfkB family carbohydrate kinase n=1 Tax=Nocardioides sp. TaxID=35761 RepID=UPI002CBB5103|nr:PfkB family carbohydrate kinase [Nocardioides sp.]HTW14718.1 PfkB family carbohydrate kinase [Nocardioides sp.]